jgi:hypothetical protein
MIPDYIAENGIRYDEDEYGMSPGVFREIATRLGIEIKTPDEELMLRTTYGTEITLYQATVH